LAKVFAIVDETRMAPILVNICTRIRPAFDKENDEIRTSSFELFGSLYRFGTGTAANSFYDQIHYQLPALVLHLNDDSDAVKSACKSTLKSIAPLFRSEEVKKLLLTLDPNRELEYTEFLNDFSKLLIENYPDKLNHYVMTSIDYFRSSWNSIKSNGAIFIGYLLTNLPVEKRKVTSLNPSLISKALIGLLKEKSPDVRKTAAEAMSLLYNY